MMKNEDISSDLWKANGYSSVASKQKKYETIHSEISSSSLFSLLSINQSIQCLFFMGYIMYNVIINVI